MMPFAVQSQTLGLEMTSLLDRHVFVDVIFLRFTRGRTQTLLSTDYVNVVNV